MSGLLSRGAANSRGGSGFVYAKAFYKGVHPDPEKLLIVFKVYAYHGQTIISRDENFEMPFGSSADQAAQKYADQVFEELPAI